MIHRTSSVCGFCTFESAHQQWGPLSRCSQSVGRADSTCAQEGELAQKFSEGQSVAVGCQPGALGELNSYLSLDPLRFDREKSEGTEKTPQSHPPPGPGNCVTKVPRGDSPGPEGSPLAVPDPEVKRTGSHCRGPGAVVQAGGWEGEKWGEAGVAPGVTPAISQV